MLRGGRFLRCYVSGIQGGRIIDGGFTDTSTHRKYEDLVEAEDGGRGERMPYVVP